MKIMHVHVHFFYFLFLIIYWTWDRIQRENEPGCVPLILSNRMRYWVVLLKFFITCYPNIPLFFLLALIQCLTTVTVCGVKSSWSMIGRCAMSFFQEVPGGRMLGQLCYVAPKNNLLKVTIYIFILLNCWILGYYNWLSLLFLFSYCLKEVALVYIYKK